MSLLPSVSSGKSSATWRWVLGPFVFTRVLIVAIGWLSSSVVKPGRWWTAPWGAPKDVVDLFLRWDVEWFLRIVRKGYSYSPGQQSPVAFFPLYPTLVHVLASVGISDVALGILVSNIALYVAATLGCMMWTAEYGSERIGRAGAVLLLVWPVSFFHSTIYCDATFIALLAGVLIAGRAGRWHIAGSLGFLLAMTRQIGVLVLIPLLLDAWGVWLPANKKPTRAGLAWLALIPGGTLSYMAFLWRNFGDPLAFVHVGDGGQALAAQQCGVVRHRLVHVRIVRNPRGDPAAHRAGAANLRHDCGAHGATTHAPYVIRRDLGRAPGHLHHALRQWLLDDVAPCSGAHDAAESVWNLIRKMPSSRTPTDCPCSTIGTRRIHCRIPSRSRIRLEGIEPKRRPSIAAQRAPWRPDFTRIRQNRDDRNAAQTRNRFQVRGSGA